MLAALVGLVACDGVEPPRELEQRYVLGPDRPVAGPECLQVCGDVQREEGSPGEEYAPIACNALLVDGGTVLVCQFRRL